MAGNLIRNIVRHEKINEQNIKNTEIFLTSLINGTNKFDYTIKEKYEAKVKEAGKMRIEGKEYIVQDGDVMHFRFNV